MDTIQAIPIHRQQSKQLNFLFYKKLRGSACKKNCIKHLLSKFTLNNVIKISYTKLSLQYLRCNFMGTNTHLSASFQGKCAQKTQQMVQQIQHHNDRPITS